ncbi:ATP-binding protein [Kutzneria kofuensis]|uniref:histidine kinase n=1 Tax=Kutzneria kofuensis TaxID=103725 RepID=A0A7W9NGB9_9PSEU|nr:ATP-binding protein [Kutzneria kofuensis]MBB5890933.1 signal transduction histidine kinase [Kutzneria kofuensis]
MDVETLRGIALFAALDGEQLAWLAQAGTQHSLADGDVLFRDGERADAFYVLVDGELAFSARDASGREQFLTRHVRRANSVVGRAETDHDGKPRAAHEFTGELPLLADADYMATAVAVGPTEVLRYAKPQFFEMLVRCPQVCTVLLPVLAWRIHASEVAVRRRATLEALGTLAAGLAHELNNPAAAVSRSASELADLMPQLLRDCSCLGRRAEPEELAAVNATIDGIRNRAPLRAVDPLDAMDAMDEVTDWLEDRGIDSGSLADDLVECGLRVADLDALAAQLRPDVVGPAVEVVAGSLRGHATVAEVVGASSRISTLIASTKAYSDMDRASERDEVDVVEGIEATLTMLVSKLSGIRVVRDYRDGLPTICGRPSELNQVWTNLVDNAVDAMPGGGTLTITADGVGDDLLVEFRDTGCGVPADALPRLFQPFFTTKDVGRGTGLGLYLSHEIVARRHGGAISVSSEPGDTRFCVRLPVRS